MGESAVVRYARCKGGIRTRRCRPLAAPARHAVALKQLFVFRKLIAPARWTGPSTNATCQPEKPESQQGNFWPRRLNPGVELALPRARLKTREVGGGNYL
jgi:hypothetical protein